MSRPWIAYDPRRAIFHVSRWRWYRRWIRRKMGLRP